MIKFTPLPIEKRTAFDNTGKPVEGALPQGLCELHGLNEGPLLLLNGIEGRTGGFGLAHIEANHSRIKQIGGLGYKSVHAFIRYVFENYSIIAIQLDKRLIIISAKAADYYNVVCQWDDDRSVWSVTTALPKRHRRNLNVIWEALETDETA